MAKTLLKELSQSPYYARDIYGVFSKILFKPGYALQSAELLELQDVIQEQVKKFGSHIFRDGSIVSGGNITYKKCYLYELEDASANMELKIPTDAQIIFTTTTDSTNILADSSNFVKLNSGFVENGILYPKGIAIQENVSASLGTNAIDVFYRSRGSSPIKIGTLAKNTPRVAMFASIAPSVFYVSGYFTNIEGQNHIFTIDDVTNYNLQVGVELIWEIITVDDTEYGSKLFDPAQNSYNANAPGADRLRLYLNLAHRPLQYVESATDWKFVPLLKFENGQLKLHVRYPIYNELGDTLARRTYEINGNFVVDEFPIRLSESTQIPGEHIIASNEYDSSEEANIITLFGEGTKYKELEENDISDVDHYLMFGNEIDYNRLLRIKEIVSDNEIKLSDIHYDRYEDSKTNFVFPDVGEKLGILRNEENVNVVLGSGKAYLEGYRFETSFDTFLEKQKARKWERNDTIEPAYHYEQTLSVVNTQYSTTEEFEFQNLQVVDLHAVNKTNVYQIIFQEWASPNTVPITINDTIEFVGDAKFEYLGNDLYRQLVKTKNTTSGVPDSIGSVYSVEIGSSTSDLTLQQMNFQYSAPFEPDSVSSYTSEREIPITANTSTGVFDTIEFTSTSGAFDIEGFSQHDIVCIYDDAKTTIIAEGKIISTIGIATTEVLVETIGTKFVHNENYKMVKISSEDYYQQQYNSSKLGTVRIYGSAVGTTTEDKLKFSHLNVSNEHTFIATGIDVANNQISARTTGLSFINDAYTDLTLRSKNFEWIIGNFDGQSQTFTVITQDTASNLMLGSISVGDELRIYGNISNAKSLAKSSYSKGTSFSADLILDGDLPKINLPSGSQRRYDILNVSGKTEIKNVDVESYDTFDQFILKTNVFSNEISMTNELPNYYPDDEPSISTDLIRVYAISNIDDGASGTRYFAGETIAVSSAKIVTSKLIVTLADAPFNGNTSFIVHAKLPVVSPQLRTKTLTYYKDQFEVNYKDWVLETNERHRGKNIFELKHSDIYRIRSIRVGNGKKNEVALIDYMEYFIQDNGQRETFYDHGTIQLRPYMKLPVPTSSNSFIHFTIEYDYFEPGDGHFFTVNSYKDIHYRNIPTYVGPNKEEYPQRNMIDWRPVRRPIGQLNDFENESCVLHKTNLYYEAYFNEEKIVSLKRSDGPKIQIEMKDKENFVDGNNIMHLYNISIPAYTFSYEDLIVEMIDNSSYTMRDIAKLQTRIENLEDIAQLNSLELQAIQSKFMGLDGDQTFANGLLVDMFSGFSASYIEEDGFQASIDLEKMKLYPAFDSYVSNLVMNSKVPPAGVVRNQNVIMLEPIANGDVIIADGFTDETLSRTAQLNIGIATLSLFPNNDIWYSKEVKPDIMLNEENQFRNWNKLKKDAHGTQWADWEQFWSGTYADEKERSLGATTLSQKTNRLLNNKNNIVKIVDNRKVNTTLSFKNREKRVGFVAEMLDANETYTVLVANQAGGIFTAGQRLRITSSNSLENLKKIHLQREISQTIGMNTAIGTVQKIVFISAKEYDFYVTNITSHRFDATNSALDSFTGTLDEVTEMNQSDANGVFCGDITIPGELYPTKGPIEIRLRDSADLIVASSQFYLGGLLPTQTSLCKSVRPVQRKLFSTENEEYIEDKTIVVHGNSAIPVPLNQSFVLDEACLLKKFDFYVENDDKPTEMAVTIQPYLNGSLSPSLVLPFSEKIISIAADYEGEITVEFDVPVYLQSHTYYAITFQTKTNCSVRTRSITANENIFVNALEKAKPAGDASVMVSEVIQLKLYKAQYRAEEKEILLNVEDSSLDDSFDRLRLNFSDLALTNTTLRFDWRARSYDSPIDDLEYFRITPNVTEVAKRRKIINRNVFALRVSMNTTNSNFTPMLDLNRLYLSLIKHHINNGKFRPNMIELTRTNLDPADTEIVYANFADEQGNQMSFDIDSIGVISNFYSDDRFSLEHPPSSITPSLWQYNAMTNVLEPKKAGIQITFDNLYSEFHDNTSLGNLDYRYYSQVVTLVDQFEAMQLHLQTDAILSAGNEIYVYYRTLDATKEIDDIQQEPFQKMKMISDSSNKYSNDGTSRTLEFNSKRDITNNRFKYFQVKIAFASSQFVNVPILENVRILALDN
jgi:hypothetical protein